MTTPHTTSADIAEAVCQAVAELGDRNSPADWPEAMLVTGDELHLIVTEALAASAPVAPTQREEEMSMLIRRIVSSARRNCEDNSNVLKLANGAWSYLARNGLTGSALRDEGIASAAPVAPAPTHAVPNLTLEPEMRAAMQAVFDAESVPVRPAPLTDTFVQTVPDKCDRIVWRNNYYHLPIAAAPKADHIEDDLAMAPAPLQQGEYLPLPEPAIKACHCYSTNQVREAIDADRAARGAAQAAPAPVAEDAANWHWLASYLVGPRTDLDDEIVASESVNDLRKLVSAARAKAAQPEGGAKT